MSNIYILLILCFCLPKLSLTFGSEQAYTEDIYMQLGNNTHAIEWGPYQILSFSMNSTCYDFEVFMYRQSANNSLILSLMYSQSKRDRYFRTFFNDNSTVPIYLFATCDGFSEIYSYTINVSLSSYVNNKSKYNYYVFNSTITSVNYFFKPVVINNFDPSENVFFATILGTGLGQSSGSTANITMCALLSEKMYGLNSTNRTMIKYSEVKNWTFLSLTSCYRTSRQGQVKQFYFSKATLMLKYTKNKYSIAVAVVPPIAGSILIIFIVIWLCRCPPACLKKKQTVLEQAILNDVQVQMQSRVHQQIRILRGNLSNRALIGLYSRQVQITCSVCLDQNCDAGLPCFHLFHSKCIQDWLNRRDGCPVCRRNYKLQDVIKDILN